jgi:hypothetical protein
MLISQQKIEKLNFKLKERQASKQTHTDTEIAHSFNFNPTTCSTSTGGTPVTDSNTKFLPQNASLPPIPSQF